jgi:hypothetical protein
VHNATNWYKLNQEEQTVINDQIALYYKFNEKYKTFANDSIFTIIKKHELEHYCEYKCTTFNFGNLRSRTN